MECCFSQRVLLLGVCRHRLHSFTWLNHFKIHFHMFLFLFSTTNSYYKTMLANVRLVVNNFFSCLLYFLPTLYPYAFIHSGFVLFCFLWGKYLFFFPADSAFAIKYTVSSPSLTPSKILDSSLTICMTSSVWFTNWFWDSHMTQEGPNYNLLIFHCD